MFDQFTLGIEEEFQIVDPVTRELRSHIAEILDRGRMLLGEQIKPEMQALNRWEAIDELINSLVESGRIKPEHREAIVGVVKKRESSMSTGIGFGIGRSRRFLTIRATNCSCRNCKPLRDRY